MPEFLSPSSPLDNAGSIAALYRAKLDTVTKTADATCSVEDFGKVVYMQSAGAISYTVNQDSTMTQPPATDTMVVLCQDGAGALTITAGSGVTILPADQLVLAGQGQMRALIRRGANSYYVR